MVSIKGFSKSLKLDSSMKTRKIAEKKIEQQPFDLPLLIRQRRPRRTKQQLEVLQFLHRTKSGYAKLKEIPHYKSLLTLLERRRLIKVWLSFKKGVGDYPRRTDEKLFNKGFYNQRFICVDRTALVRLFMHALKKPETFLARKRVTTLCKRYLTYAERIAVLWNLGIRQFHDSQRKRNMQIDGKYFPIGYKTTEASK